MKLSICCKGVSPEIIHSKKNENYILIIICPDCTGMVKAENVPYNKHPEARHNLILQWNKVMKDKVINQIDEMTTNLDDDSLIYLCESCAGKYNIYESLTPGIINGVRSCRICCKCIDKDENYVITRIGRLSLKL